MDINVNADRRRSCLRTMYYRDHGYNNQDLLRDMGVQDTSSSHVISYDINHHRNSDRGSVFYVDRRGCGRRHEDGVDNRRGSTAESIGVETTTSTLVGTYTTVEEYVSSAGGSWVPAESPSGTAVAPGTEGSTPTASDTLTETTTLSASHAESETAGPTSVQTAGAAHVTAAVGIGAIFGLMGLLA
ncbi:hypothetical protein FVER53590_07547 [Fusarium verticillioides]|nr:hypothetical protein FVER53590_07547 [Fusarium verticillioides]